ncbi:hypothetical protein ZIOFF_029783 [Zingiber officinale]|uniref:Uncharacterized protein n=1 Tax=Zingiber officinale TaxID=94328 RepID=A0A8J5LAV6_ZINOF|nr:hypothetical protein ZIOFF_029783 [Zingiber officinale]
MPHLVARSGTKEFMEALNLFQLALPPSLKRRYKYLKKEDKVIRVLSLVLNRVSRRMGWKKLVVMSVEATTQLSGVPLSMATVHDLLYAILKAGNGKDAILKVGNGKDSICTCRYEYRWADGVQIKKPIEVSAPKYVEYLMEWIEVQLDDESIFPQKLGTPFPANFNDKIVSLKEEAHLNTCFKHFILFTYEFGLIDKKEIAPLQELIESIVL